MQKRMRYLLQGGFGAVLTGAGLSGAIEVGFLKHQGAELTTWLGLGTLALSIFMSGLCIMIDAVRFQPPKK